MEVHCLWCVLTFVLGAFAVICVYDRINGRLITTNDSLREQVKVLTEGFEDRGRHDLKITDGLHRELAEVKKELRESERNLGLTQEALRRARNEKREIEQQMVLGLTKTGTLKKAGDMTLVREDILSVL